MNSSLCKNAITDTVFVELLTVQLSVLVENEGHIRTALPYAVLLSKHIEYWKSIIPDLELAGVHRTIRAIFRSYNLLSVEELCGMLVLLCSFVGHGTQKATHVDQYVSEDMHTPLIIMIQEFVLNLTVQELAWKLMKLLCRNHNQFAYALIHTGLLHCASSLLVEHNAIQLKQYIVELLAIIAMSFGAYFFQVPGLIESIAELVKKDTLEEQYMLMAYWIISKLTARMSASLLTDILDWDVLVTLKQRALQCPEKYIIPFCEVLNNIISCESGRFELLNAVFKDHYLFYQEVLCNISIISNTKLTVVTLRSLNQFIRAFPKDLFDSTLCTKSFIQPLLSLFQACTDSTVMFWVTSLLHLLFYLLGSCHNGPKVVYECDAHVALAKAFTKSLTTSIVEYLLRIVVCVFTLYNNNKTASALIDVSLQKTVVDMAIKFGRFQCPKFANEFQRCILTMTADKEFSKKLVSLSYENDLIPLISETYCAPTFEASLNALGNLAICGADIKVKLISEDELHLQVISYIREHTTDGNAGALCACCRMLYILASDDKARELFIDVGCIEILLRLLELWAGDTEICWRSLSILSSLGYAPLCNRHLLICHNVLKIVCSIIRGSSTDKAKVSASEILISFCEREDGVCLVRNTGILEDLVNMIAASSNKDFWVSIVGRLSLYTVGFQDMPGNQQQDSPDGGLPEGKCDFLSHGTDNLQHRSPKLDPRIKKHMATKIDGAFCVGRTFGSTYCICTNCACDVWAELVMCVHDMSPVQYQLLIDNGWYRRGGIDMCRVREHHNLKCCNWEVRVDALKFDHTTRKSYRKVIRRMPSNIRIKTLPAYFNKEAFNLYNSYHVSKYNKPISSEHSYAEHVLHSPYRQQEGKGGIVYGTYHQEYYFSDKLAAVGVIDVVPYGVVSVYIGMTTAKKLTSTHFACTVN